MPAPAFATLFQLHKRRVFSVCLPPRLPAGRAEPASVRFHLAWRFSQRESRSSLSRKLRKWPLESPQFLPGFVNCFSERSHYSESIPLSGAPVSRCCNIGQYAGCIGLACGPSSRALILTFGISRVCSQLLTPLEDAHRWGTRTFGCKRQFEAPRSGALSESRCVGLP
jgi:hypothetical protein